MTKPNITPGPWNLSQGRVSSKTHQTSRDLTLAVICDLDMSNDKHGEQTSNAQAIAALPGLLEACEFFVKYAGMQMSKGKPLPSQLTSAVYDALTKAGYTF